MLTKFWSPRPVAHHPIDEPSLLDQEKFRQKTIVLQMIEADWRASSEGMYLSEMRQLRSKLGLMC